MSNTTYRSTGAAARATARDDDETVDVDVDADDPQEGPTGLFSTPARAVTLVASVGLLVTMLALVVWLVTSRNSSQTIPPSQTITGPQNEVSVITKANLGREGEAPSKGKLAPDFEWNDVVTGKPMRLSTLGKPAFVNFWGTWCPPCRAEMPEMERLYKQYNGQIEFIGVSMAGRGDDPAKVKSFINLPPNGPPSFPYTWRFIHDGNYDVATRYQVQAVPSSFFVGTDGVIKAVKIGGMNGAEMEAYLQQVK